VHAPFRIHT